MALVGESGSAAPRRTHRADRAHWWSGALRYSHREQRQRAAQAKADGGNSRASRANADRNGAGADCRGLQQRTAVRLAFADVARGGAFCRCARRRRTTRTDVNRRTASDRLDLRQERILGERPSCRLGKSIGSFSGARGLRDLLASAQPPIVTARPASLLL